MGKLYRKKYIDKNGARHECPRWYGDYVDQNGIRRRVPLARDELASKKMLNELEVQSGTMADNDGEEWGQNMACISVLITAKEMSDKINGKVSANRLLELAETGIIPHYNVDNQILFGYSETKKWLNNNYCLKVPGRELGDSICSILNIVEPIGEKAVPPLCLRSIAGWLIPMAPESIETPPFSGVYFLCHEGEVVYVGQSVNLLSRVGQHFGSKTFSSVFFVRIPQSDLNYVEGRFIKLLKPKYNISKGGRLTAPSAEGKFPSVDAERLVDIASNAVLENQINN